MEIRYRDAAVISAGAKLERFSERCGVQGKSDRDTEAFLASLTAEEVDALRGESGGAFERLVFGDDNRPARNVRSLNVDHRSAI